MKLAIYITLTEKPPPLTQNLYFGWLKEKMPEVQQYDFDNHSEGFVMQAVFPLLAESKKILVLIENEPQAKLGVVLAFLQTLSQYLPKVRILYHTPSPMLAKMLQPFEHLSLENINWQEEITSFFKELS